METTLYQLIDNQTGNVLGTYTYAQRNRARNRADKLDLQHGGIRYIVRPIFDRSNQAA